MKASLVYKIGRELARLTNSVREVWDAVNGLRSRFEAVERNQGYDDRNRQELQKRVEELTGRHEEFAKFVRDKLKERAP